MRVRTTTFPLRTAAAAKPGRSLTPPGPPGRLSNLTTIGGDLVLGGLLTTLTGLEKLTTVGRDLALSGVDALQSIDALANLASIGGDATISWS